VETRACVFHVRLYFSVECCCERHSGNNSFTSFPGMKVLIDARSKLLHDNKFGIPWQNDMNAIHAEKIFQFDNNTCIDSRLFSTYVDELKSLWDDVAIRQAFERRSEYQLGDSIQYFFDNWDRISRRVRIYLVYPARMRLKSPFTPAFQTRFYIFHG
jgi:G-protein alpha subunit.